MPEIKDVKEEGCKVAVEWTKPQSIGCPILSYTIRYKRQKAKNWTSINVTDPNSNHWMLVLQCATTYEFEVVASNEVGTSLPSKVRSVTTGGDTTKEDPYRGISMFVLCTRRAPCGFDLCEHYVTDSQFN